MNDQKKPNLTAVPDSAQTKHRRPRPKMPTVDDLELALTVILVDLASSDQKFEPQEYQIINAALYRLFGTPRDKVQKLVNQATLVLANLRGTTRYAELLRDHLDLEHKQLIIQMMDDLILADGEQDGFEIYLRHKFLDILGFEEAEVEPAQ